MSNSFLNLELNRTAYLASVPSQNPSQKVFEFSSGTVGLPVQDPICATKTIYSDSTVEIANTTRTVLIDDETEIAVQRVFPTENLVRLRWNGIGAHPGFRTYRATGHDDTTMVSFVRSSPSSMKLEVVSGKAMDFSSVILGDEVYMQATDATFTSPFLSNNTGRSFKIIDKSANYIIFRDDGIGYEQYSVLLGSDYDSALRIFSSSGVKTGDMVDFTESCGFKPSNKEHRLLITGVTDREISFNNPYAIEEVAIPGADTVRVFDKLINLIVIESSGPIDVSFDDGEFFSVSEYQPGQAFFAGSVAASKISLRNSLENAINVVFQAASLI